MFHKFYRFATAMQADQAIIHENNQLFQQGTLLSVLPLSKDLVTKLQFQSIDMLIASNRSKLDIDTTTEQSQRSHIGEIGAAYRYVQVYCIEIGEVMNTLIS